MLSIYKIYYIDYFLMFKKAKTFIRGKKTTTFLQQCLIRWVGSDKTDIAVTFRYSF
jgi:hypothetical protein